MLDLIVTILFGFILETIYFGYIFNKIKKINFKSTYIIYLISYIIGASLISFMYQNIFYGYIITSFVFSILYPIKHKIEYKITDMLMLLNIILFNSLLFTVPLFFLGYNEISMIVSRIMIIIFIIIIRKINLNKEYNKIVLSWNRGFGGKFKSITVRNITLISLYLMITIINIFLNNYFLNIYEKLL